MQIMLSKNIFKKKIITATTQKQEGDSEQSTLGGENIHSEVYSGEQNFNKWT